MQFQTSVRESTGKYWLLIGLLFFYSAWQTWRSHSLSESVTKAKIQCQTTVKNEIAKAIKPYLDAQDQTKKKAEKASVEYENDKSEQRVRTEAVTREVQKIIERPNYYSTCLDTAGLSALNSLITNDTR